MTLEKLMALIEDFAEQRHKQGLSTYNEKTLQARNAVLSELTVIFGKAEAYDIWIKKTEWMEGTYSVHELGKHKADVLTERVQATADDIVKWACERWRFEVGQRPIANVHRRSLDDVWRQVVRRYGGNDRELLGPTHDELRAAENDKPD